MKKTTTGYLKRSLALLELAQGKAEDARLFWRAVELQPWESVRPSWRVTGNKIYFKFRFQDQTLELPVASVKATPSGVDLFLTVAASPIPEKWEIRWSEPERQSSPEPPRMWTIVRHWLRKEFPGYRLIRCVKRTDRCRTLSGLFLRADFQYRGKSHFLIAAEESAGDDASSAVGQALLWLETAGLRIPLHTIPEIHILVPSSIAPLVFHRARHIDPALVHMNVWAYDWPETDSLRIQPAEPPPDPIENVDYRWPVLGPFRWSSNLETVLGLAPDLIRRYPRFHEYDSLRLYGLEFAQVTGTARDCIRFGVGPGRTELTQATFDHLKELVAEILYYRRPDSPDMQHPYYRLQAERWLEALVLERIHCLFPEIAPEAVYSQIPVYLGNNPGRIDILGANCQGNLVIMELKVAADADLPLQALDYWGRVIQHNLNGDFIRRGYFSEVQLNRRSPSIYLVAPVFSFHDSTEALLRYLVPKADIHKIAINEDWRSGVKILGRSCFDRKAPIHKPYG